MRGGLEGRESGRIDGAGREQLALEPLEGILRAPRRLLLACAVLVARIGEGVAVVAVRAGLEEDGAVAVAAQRRRALDRVPDREHVHAVDGLGVQVVLREAGPPAGQVVHAHHLVVGAMGHPVVVVLDEVDDRQPERPLAARWFVHCAWAAQLSDSRTTPLAYAPSPAKQHTTRSVRR